MNQIMGTNFAKRAFPHFCECLKGVVQDIFLGAVPPDPRPTLGTPLTPGDDVTEWSGCESTKRAKRYSEDRGVL